MTILVKHKILVHENEHTASIFNVTSILGFRKTLLKLCRCLDLPQGQSKILRLRAGYKAV